MPDYRIGAYNIREYNVGILKQYADDYYKLVNLRSVRKAGYEDSSPSPVLPAARCAANNKKLSNNLSRARSAVYALARCNPWSYFVTLTLDPSKVDRNDLKAAYRKLAKWINNYNSRHNCKVLYLLVPEPHKDGAWHFHGLLSGLPLDHLISGCVGTDIYLPVLLGLSLGLRRGEALGLQWDDIDMDAKTVTIIHSASFRKGGFLLSSTKTRNSRRTLIMPDALYIALKDAYNKQQREAAIFGDGYNPYHLVCCLPDGMPITSGILQHRFHDVLTSCGLPSIRFHDLRHTNATLMLRNRIPAKIVSAMLGHSSIGITMDTYSHVMTDMQEGAIDVMDGLLKGLY